MPSPKFKGSATLQFRPLSFVKLVLAQNITSLAIWTEHPRSSPERSSRPGPGKKGYTPERSFGAVATADAVKHQNFVFEVVNSMEIRGVILILIVIEWFCGYIFSCDTQLDFVVADKMSEKT